MNFARLLLINAIATFAAGIVLFVAPELIAGAVGIRIDRGAYFLYYLLGASELGLATLCFCGRTLTEPQSLRVVALTAIVFHAASGVAGVYGFTQGLSAAVWWNVLLRVGMVMLFAYYGLGGRLSQQRTDLPL